MKLRGPQKEGPDSQPSPLDPLLYNIPMTKISIPTTTHTPSPNMHPHKNYYKVAGRRPVAADVGPSLITPILSAGGHSMGSGG